jgi:hypothetical protein
MPTEDDPSADIGSRKFQIVRPERMRGDGRVGGQGASVEARVETAHKQNWDDVSKLMFMFLPPALILMFGSAIAWTI